MPRARHPIALARQGRHLNRAELAQLVGAAETDVARWEQGTAHPTAAEAVRVARVLRLSLSEVLICLIEEEARAGRIPPQGTPAQILRGNVRIPTTRPLALEAHR